MSRYIPQPAYPDMMPVDISFVFEDEKPAGKHGFLKADGEEFRFEDGTPGRFWGVNFNGAACFPSHEYAPKVARRLAMAGCNVVRFHQLEAEWHSPNIFNFSRGRRMNTTRKLDEKSMDCLDYLVYCLKEEGIYVYLDMMTYRRFKEGDDVPEYWNLAENGRPWALIDPRLIELQKEFMGQLWNHFNPYTKLVYKDDPVFILSELVNEEDLFVDHIGKKADFVHATYYENEFRQFFKEWLAEKGIEYDWENCDLYANDPTQVAFKIHLTEKYNRELRAYLRSIGVKIPITGTNWTKCNANIYCQREMDYTDAHGYFYDWRWGNTERTCDHRSITSAPFAFAGMSKMKQAGKPFFVSEWDMPWPNSFRAEGPIYFAAIGALQGWGGFTIHTYAYGTRLENMKVLGREGSSPLAGVPYREGIFSTWNDPAKFGLFYHAALMMRRRDVSPAEKKIAVKSAPDGANLPSTAQSTGLEQHRMATVFTDEIPAGYDEIWPDNKAYPIPKPGVYASDNGQLVRDLTKRVGMVKTPRTKIAYGFLNRASSQSTQKRVVDGIDLDGVVIEGKTDFGVIAMSSLTDDPIEKSDNILLSAIGRARNTGAQFDGTKMLELGEPPIQAEVISAKITMKTDKPKRLRVWGVNAEGFYAGKCAVTDNGDGTVTFEIGDENNPACYYLIVAE